MIKYMGTKSTSDGGVLYVFLINGLQKEIREHALKQYPGCYEALPPTAKARISANRARIERVRQHRVSLWRRVWSLVSGRPNA